MEVWRLIMDVPRSGSFNMAADHLLLDNYSRDDHPVFRVYEWESPVLSFGRNEKLDHRINLYACESQGIPIIRRITGGKSVLHGFDITYSIVGGFKGKQFCGGVLENYRFLAKGFYSFFEELGLDPKLNEGNYQKLEVEERIETKRETPGNPHKRVA